MLYIAGFEVYLIGNKIMYLIEIFKDDSKYFKKFNTINEVRKCIKDCRHRKLSFLVYKTLLVKDCTSKLGILLNDRNN